MLRWISLILSQFGRGVKQNAMQNAANAKQKTKSLRMIAIPVQELDIPARNAVQGSFSKTIFKF